MVQAHQDIGPHPDLEVDDVLGFEEDLGAVEVGGEPDPLVARPDER